jgi:AcrR family transcriptional regulator
VHSAYPQTSAEHPEEGRSRPLRRDAQANRERILAAAASVFSEQGLDGSVEEIAERAGVGVGTLYRRFPNKDALVDAIFESTLNELAADAEAALEAADSWDGLCAFLERAVALQAENRGFAEIVAVHLRAEQLLAKARSRVRPLLAALVARAQADGSLRPDVVYEDISVLLWTSGRVVDSTRDVAPEFWRRHLALTLDGLRAERATPLPHPPLTSDQHWAAMQRLAGQLKQTRPT